MGLNPFYYVSDRVLLPTGFFVISRYLCVSVSLCPER